MLRRVTVVHAEQIIRFACGFAVLGRPRIVHFLEHGQCHYHVVGSFVLFSTVFVVLSVSPDAGGGASGRLYVRLSGIILALKKPSGRLCLVHAEIPFQAVAPNTWRCETSFRRWAASCPAPVSSYTNGQRRHAAPSAPWKRLWPAAIWLLH